MADIKEGPIEVWLTQANLQVRCTIVNQDETTHSDLPIDSLSMRGAQREITGYLIEQGYKPDGRWKVEVEDGQGAESVRRFKPVPQDL